MGSHVSTWPPRCSECKKFMKWSSSKVVREYTGTQMNPDCDDIEVGVCERCKNEEDGTEVRRDL